MNCRAPATWPFRAGVIAILAFGSAFVAALPNENRPPLETCAAVLDLSGAQAAQRAKVVLEGTVTATEPDWDGRFFLQDATAGVFIDGVEPQPAVGDVVTVTGFTDPGSFAPMVVGARWTKRGHGPLPAAYAAPVDQLMSGALDSLRVEVSGLVRAERHQGNRFIIDLAVGGFRVPVVTQIPGDIDPESLIGCHLKVRGTAAASYNSDLRHLTTVNIFVPTLADFTLEGGPSADPFNEPVLPINQVAQFRRNANPARRLHIKGVVTCVRPGLDLFVQDYTGGLEIRGDQLGDFNPGEVIDVVGFLDFVSYLPVLDDALARRSRDPIQPVRVISPPVEELLQGRYPSEPVRIRGKVLDGASQPVRLGAAGLAATQVVWTLQNDAATFTAELETTDGGVSPALLPVGSVAEITGICASSTYDDGRIKHLQLIVPTVHDVRVVTPPSWLTPQHLAIGLIALCLVSILGALWTVTLSKKNTELGLTIKERERAERDLREAHGLLEQRVQERTEQLKFEMSSRKQAELQFKAVLMERTRLAQELHDTLEQTLIGIALQLDTAARLSDGGAQESARHLGIAVNWLRQSQVELRRSIWDLRSRALDEFDLAKALARSGSQIAEASGIEVTMETVGTPKQLPEVVEENLLRIGQEALTNVVKHSGATKVAMSLTFSQRRVSLEVRDNGRGLESGANDNGGSGHNHFGLLGMSERARRLAGRLEVSGASGEGVTVRVDIPLGLEEAII